MRDNHRALDTPSGILDRRRQSKLVSADVEDHILHPTVMIQIRRAECSPDVRKGTPYGPFHDIGPSHKRVSGLWMFLPETLQQWFSNNPHVYIMYTHCCRTQAKSCRQYVKPQNRVSNLHVSHSCMVVVLCVFGGLGGDAIPREFEVSGLKFEVFPLCSSHFKLEAFSEPLHGVTTNDA